MAQPGFRLYIRCLLGGVLMGLANLVPGISGGTMLLAAGVYPRFVAAVSDVTRLKIGTASLLVLGSVGGAAAAAVVLLAGVLKDLVVDQRWLMYSLFIGLTLGGLPVVWQLARSWSRALVAGSVAGFLLMVALAWAQARGITGGGSGAPLLALAGLAGASAMILPGISGGYLLLLLGQYVPILSAIDQLKDAIGARDLGAAWGPAVGVVLPVGVGVVVGIAVVSNVLRWLLERYRKATLGLLLGLLLGSVIGLWPFQQSVDPIPGETRIKGTLVTASNLSSFEREDYPTEYFHPSAGQGVLSVLLVLVGFGTTLGISRLGAAEGL